MDKIEKALKNLTVKERKQIQLLLKKLSSDDLKSLDIKKLQGRDDIFRARKGELRIIYRREGKTFFILKIERRAENTYRFLKNKSAPHRVKRKLTKEDWMAFGPSLEETFSIQSSSSLGVS